MKTCTAWAALALVFAASSVVEAADPPLPADLPVDTVLRVRLDDTIGSDRSRPGDRFVATVEDPSLPSDTLVRGVVVGARPAHRSEAGRMAVDFRTLELPSGRQIPIAGSPASLDAKSVSTTEDGRLVARTHPKGEPDKYLGYGAAGGLAIGSLLGSNVIGGVLGAGAGYLFGKKARHRDVVLREGTEIGVRMDHGVTLIGS